ncbi:MAG: peptidylprolyl isomerase [Planctomycetota bacterium]
MNTALLLLTLAVGQQVPVRTGAPINFDGRIAPGEWADGFTLKGADEPGYQLHLKRVGPMLAIGVSSQKGYNGEVIRIVAGSGAARQIVGMVLGLGQPEAPAAVWRRGSPQIMRDAPESIKRECPRGVRARVLLGKTDSWSAEYLVSLAALGIGRGDAREFKGIIAISDNQFNARLSMPKNVDDFLDTNQYARWISADSWGAAEKWEPTSPEISREYDDNELLFRLYSEHDKFSRQRTLDQLVISNAVRPRSAAKIESLKREIEAGMSRNPTLPAWLYYRGRLLHQANYFQDARKAIESVPEPLRGVGGFAQLAFDHYLDTQEWEFVLDMCKRFPPTDVSDTALKRARIGQKFTRIESEAHKRDVAKPERNPVVVFDTARGEIHVELFEDDAPAAVLNFMDLVLRTKYYDRMRFHNVVGASFAQVGDPRTRPNARTKADGPGWRVRQDPPKRPSLRGSLGLLPIGDGTQHGSQIILTAVPFFEARGLVVFGRIIKGQEILNLIEQDDQLKTIRVAKDENGKEIRRNHAYQADVVRLK